MSKLSEFLKMESDFFKHKKSVCDRLLQTLEPGRLNVSTINNHDYYYTNDDHERHYLGTHDSDNVQGRIKYHFLDRYSRILDNNIDACNTCLHKLKEYDPYAVADSFTKAYRQVPDDLMSTLGFIPRSVLSDEQSPVYRASGLKHKTASGIMVRSKSEVLIANTYTGFDVPFEYEKLLVLPNGTEILPDFTLISKDRSKLIYHEHIGMLSDPGYREHFHKKLDLYIDSGLIPFYDVFFTFEDENGNINFEIIYKIIKNILGY